MLQRQILFILLLFSFAHNALSGQANEVRNVPETVEKASYLHGDISTILSGRIRYPLECLLKKIQGPVVLSVLIDSLGKMDSITIIETPSKIFSEHCIEILQEFDKDWNPSRVNDIPISKKYVLVINFRMSINGIPKNHAQRAHEFMIDQKYKKALRSYNKAIKDNYFDHNLWLGRANVKARMENKQGATEDMAQAQKIKNEVLAMVKIAAIGRSQTRKIGTMRITH